MIIIQGNKAKYWLGILASIFLGMIYIVAGMGKWFSGVADVQLFTEGIRYAHPLFPGSSSPLIFLQTSLVLIELGVGILLASGIWVRVIASFSLLLTAGFITNNIILIASGLGGAPCGCFGMGNRLTVFDSLLLDGVMVALAITILCWYPARFFEARPWFWRK